VTSSPTDPNRAISDHQLPPEAYRRMTVILRGGLLLSLAVLAVVLSLYVAVHSGSTSSQTIASNPVLNYLSVPGLASGLAHGSLEAYLTLGLLVLLATPILRVASGFYYFEKEGDRPLAAITFTVLVLIFLGLLVIGPLFR